MSTEKLLSLPSRASGAVGEVLRGEGGAATGGWRWGDGGPALLGAGKCNVIPHSPPNPMLNLDGPSQAPEKKK